MKIHFTVKDLARTHLKASLGPVAEAVFALGVISRGGYPPYESWRNLVAGQLRDLAGPVTLLDLQRSKIRAPDELLWLVGHVPVVPTHALDLPRQQATVEALTLWRVAVAPYWNRILGYLESDCAGRGRITMSRGVEGLLATLHPHMVWDLPVLEVPDGTNRDVFLRGRGLQLVPSVFLVDRPGVLLGSVGKSRQPGLVFSSPPNPTLAAALWQASADPGEVLGALIGQTRAAALRELTDLRTTRELAERLGISSAGASQHTAVLRQAGLINTRRLRNTALHTVTELGMALLDGGNLTAAAPLLA
jgi:DNA-binding transcriptional ArsR family regulator